MSFAMDIFFIIYIINNMSRFVLKDHAMKLVKEDDNNAGDKEELKKEADKLKLNVLTMPDVTKNLLVIKYLRKLMGNVKIVLAVSSWDVKGDYHSIEDYFKTICPAIYNYVRYNFESYMFCGVSAQGANYDQPGKDLSSLTEKGQRAYIFTDRKIYDLSTPLEFLISE